MDYNITPQEIEEGKGMGGLAYITWVGLIIAFLVGKENRYTMYHVQQALALMIAWFALSIVGVIPILGWIVAVVGNIAAIVFLIMGIINGFSGKVQPLHIIGQFGFKFNLVKPVGDAPTPGDQTPPQF